MRKVGAESQKTYDEKRIFGFFDKYMYGLNGLDIGYAGYIEGTEPILPTAIGVDIGYHCYDGKTLPFEDNSQDYVYNSHCLEHISDYKQAIQEWFRVLRLGGHLIIAVPHMYLYEKKPSLPSRWNGDHKRFYTPSSLLKEIEDSLLPNSYRVRYLEDGDAGFDYSIPPNMHSGGQYELTVVIQKIKPPDWTISPI